MLTLGSCIFEFYAENTLVFSKYLYCYLFIFYLDSCLTDTGRIKKKFTVYKYRKAGGPKKPNVCRCNN